jgi:serine/threonine protein kinase
MLHESRVLAQFTDQPNIVQVLDCIEENGTAYIVMEYLRGETVQMILRREGQMTPERTMQIIIPVLRALETIHQTGLIHRDISPDNLFVCEDGNVKLLDFGAARFADGVDQKTLSVMLKKGFAPIEQYSSHGRQGPFTDVYAVCATMYRMLTGVTPESSLERMAADTLRPISEITQIPHGVEAVILQGMAVQATDRIQSAGELCDALQRAFRQAEDAYPAAEKKRAQKTPRFLTRARMKRICVVLIVLILAALIALGVVLALRAGAL